MGDLKYQNKDITSGFSINVRNKTQSNVNILPDPIQNFHDDKWDARHLDKFLQDKNWSTTPSIPTNSSRQQLLRTNKYGQGTPMKLNLQAIQSKRKTLNTSQTLLELKGPDNFNQDQPKSDLRESLNNISHQNSFSQQDSRPSYFFHTIARFVDKPEENYQIRDFASNYSSKNFLITNTNQANHVYDKEAVEFYNQNYSKNEKHFQQDKLQFSNLPIQLQNPSQKLQELRETQENQKNYKQWKESEILKSKKYRLHTYDYRSGILQVDDPYNDKSELYKTDAQKLSNILKSQKNRVIEKQELQSRHVNTNCNIEFFNKNHQKIAPNTVDHKYEKLNPIWKNKKRIEEGFIQTYADSQNRLFGAEEKFKFNKNRAQYLFNQDNRGKNYDILSYSKKNLEILN